MICSFIKSHIKKGTKIYNSLIDINRIGRNIFSSHGYFRNYILFPFGAFIRTKHIRPYYTKYEALDELRNKHIGTKGFVIATGPSLQWEDLNRLNNNNNFVTIGMNTLYKGYVISDFRPDYYMILDHDVLIDFDQSNLKLEELAKRNVFLNDMVKRKGKYIIPTPINYLDHWFNYGNEKYNYYRNLRFSEDFLWGVYDKWTTTIAAIEAAIYMGCKEIYLLGVDCNYSMKNLHFMKTEYDDEKWSPNKNLDVAETQQMSNVISYQFIKEEAERRSIKIYNATRGGSLEVFERVNFDEIDFS